MKKTLLFSLTILLVAFFTITAWATPSGRLVGVGGNQATWKTSDFVYSAVSAGLGTKTVVALTDAAATPTAAQMITSSIFTITPTAARTFTTPTAALIVAGVTGAKVGTWFDFTIVNNAAFAVTVTAASGVTISGNAVVNKGAATFRAVMTNVTSASEAVTIYRMASGSTITDMALASGKVLIGQTTGLAAEQTVSGDVTISTAGATTIGAKKVTNTMIAADAGTILVGTKTSGDVTKLDISAAGAIPIGQGAGETPAAHVLSGDVTMAASGAVTIAAKAVEDSMISAGPGTVLVGTKTDLDVTLLDNSAAGSLVIGQGAGETCAAHTLTGDVSMTSAGVVSLTMPKIIAAVSADTMTQEENVAGLSSAITLANEVRGDIINHFANATRHTTGQQSTAAIAAEATNLASLITLTTSVMSLYVAHNADMVLASTWLYHNEQGADKALASEEAPTTLAQCVTKLNDVKAKLNDHEDETTGHASQASVTADQVAASDAAYGTTNRITVTGAAASDIVVWGILNDGTGNVTGASATAGTNYVDFVFSADPQNDAIISYVVMRAP
jgi:hypothetical protein